MIVGKTEALTEVKSIPPQMTAKDKTLEDAVLISLPDYFFAAL